MATLTILRHGERVEYRRHPYDPEILHLEARILRPDGTPFDDRWYPVNDDSYSLLARTHPALLRSLWALKPPASPLADVKAIAFRRDPREGYWRVVNPGHARVLDALGCPPDVVDPAGWGGESLLSVVAEAQAAGITVVFRGEPGR